MIQHAMRHDSALKRKPEEKFRGNAELIILTNLAPLPLFLLFEK